MCEQFFFKLVFFKTNKIIPLIIFYVFTIIISITPKNNFSKEKRMYEHILYIIIHVYEYLCLFMYVYTYLYIFMKHFLSNDSPYTFSLQFSITIFNLFTASGSRFVNFLKAKRKLPTNSVTWVFSGRLHVG